MNWTRLAALQVRLTKKIYICIYVYFYLNMTKGINWGLVSDSVKFSKRFKFLLNVFNRMILIHLQASYKPFVVKLFRFAKRISSYKSLDELDYSGCVLRTILCFIIISNNQLTRVVHSEIRLHWYFISIDYTKYLIQVFCFGIGLHRLCTL